MFVVEVDTNVVYFKRSRSIGFLNIEDPTKDPETAAGAKDCRSKSQGIGCVALNARIHCKCVIFRPLSDSMVKSLLLKSPRLFTEDLLKQGLIATEQYETVRDSFVCWNDLFAIST